MMAIARKFPFFFSIFVLLKNYRLVRLIYEIILNLSTISARIARNNLVHAGQDIFQPIETILVPDEPQIEILPEDEIHTLKQVFYLILMSLAFIDILYALISSEGLIYFVIFDIALSLFLEITLDKSSLKGKIILLLRTCRLPIMS